jgi:hypothetical protein
MVFVLIKTKNCIYYFQIIYTVNMATIFDDKYTLLNCFFAYLQQKTSVIPQFSDVQVSDDLYYRAVEAGMFFGNGGVYVPLENRIDSYVLIDREHLQIALQNPWKVVYRESILGFTTEEIIPCARNRGLSLFKQIYGENENQSDYCFIDDEQVTFVVIQNEESSFIVVANYLKTHVWKVSDRLSDVYLPSVPLPCMIHCSNNSEEIAVTYSYSACINIENISVISLIKETGNIEWHTMFNNDLTTALHDKTYSSFGKFHPKLFEGTIKDCARTISDILQGKRLVESLGYTETSRQIKRYYKGRMLHSILNPAVEIWYYNDNSEAEYTRMWYFAGKTHDNRILISAIEKVQMFIRRIQLAQRIKQRENARETKNNFVQYFMRLPEGICGKFPQFPGGDEYRSILEECI